MPEMEKWIRLATEAGFEHAGPLDASTIVLLDDVRAMCASNHCGAYGHNWSCPPACGEIEDLRKVVAGYRAGLLVQTVGALEDEFDGEGMQEAGDLHKRRFASLHRRLLEERPNLLALGAGTCTICKQCTYPDQPCRFPDRRVSSMEAYGMLVMEVCKANGMKYYYGSRSIAYTGCFLME